MRKAQQSPWIVADELWARIEPLLPTVPWRADHPGRRRLDDRRGACALICWRRLRNLSPGQDL